MGSCLVRRRQFLRGLASLTICAPSVVRASSLMGVSARFCGSSHVTPTWAVTQDALTLLQHELERRFAETLFGAASLSEEAEDIVLTRRPLVTDAKITTLWELRTLFGPRGARPKPLDDLPAEVRAGLFSMFGAIADGSSKASAAKFSSFTPQERSLRSI
jgi:hypothetical protein